MKLFFIWRSSADLCLVAKQDKVPPQRAPKMRSKMSSKLIDFAIEFCFQNLQKSLNFFQNIKEFLENFPSNFFSLEIVERNEACFSRPAMLSCFRVCQGTRFFQSTISRVSASGAILGSLSTLISLDVSRYNCFLAPSEVTWK